jgi:hypothetical protein
MLKHSCKLWSLYIPTATRLVTNGKLMESDTPFSLYQREWWRADLRRFLNEKSWLALKK